ncbi:MAG TPA: hypothetical protein PKC67_06795 [Kiritimatiellia bacterium]|nr:hypothetical protein [Kiritimatiellia bacterium]HMP34044.1 hypothetical protein [Kiritimatiellia bacterium]
MTQTHKAIVLLLLAASPCLWLSADNTSEVSAEEQAYRTNLRGIYDNLEPVTIYGLVVDTEGHPIPDADVLVSWQHATVLIGTPDPGGRKEWVTSDENGRWAFTVTKPHRAFISDVRKDGYDYSGLVNPRASEDLINKPTAEVDPAVIVLRRKGEPTFLIIYPGGNRGSELLSRVVSPETKTNTLDLTARTRDTSGRSAYSDLHVVVAFDETISSWSVTYATTNDTDGIIAETNQLYEAPLDGYQNEIVVNGPPWPRYLYVKSRTPAIYSRLDLEHTLWFGSPTNQSLRISCKAWINPYGERNLEYQSDLDGVWRLREELEEEAISALRDNRLPAKPDLPMRIRQAKEEAEKEDQ